MGHVGLRTERVGAAPDDVAHFVERQGSGGEVSGIGAVQLAPTGRPNFAMCVPGRNRPCSSSDEISRAATASCEATASQRSSSLGSASPGCASTKSARRTAILSVSTHSSGE